MDIFKDGYIFLYKGPVLCGKSTQGMMKKSLLSNSKHCPKFQATVRFTADTRDQGAMLNHDGVALEQASNIQLLTLYQMLKKNFDGLDIILFDELHIALARAQENLNTRQEKRELEDKVYSYVYWLAYTRKKVLILCMNDFWFNGKPVSICLKIEKIASEVHTLRSKCDKCNCMDATMSQKMDTNNTELLTIGHDWLALCPRCYTDAPVFVM
jgi:thymidine kinase